MRGLYVEWNNVPVVIMRKYYLKLCLEEELLWALGAVVDFILLSMYCKYVLL